MLSALRAFSKTWIAKILIAVLIVSFGAFGISNVIFDLGNNTVARVGEQDITVRDYQRAYNAQVNQVAQQYGMVPTTEQAAALGIPGAVLGQLASEAAIDQMAQSMGIGVSDDRLSVLLRQDPAFAGTLGNFDPSQFERVLSENGFTGTDYFDLKEKAARREQLELGLFTTAVAPKAAIELANRFLGDTRNIDYFVLTEANLPPIPEPTEEELQAHLTANQAQFRTPETRTVDVLVLSPDTLAASTTIGDAQIAAEYERTKDKLTRQERRAIQQVVLPSDEVAAAFEAAQAAGRPLAEIAAEQGLTVTELGTLAKAEVTDPALAEAAFGLAQGQFTIIPGAAGRRAIGISVIEPGGTPALPEVRDQIRNTLALTAARNDVMDILDQVEDLRASFRPLAEIASRFNLTVTPVTVTTGGAELQNVPGLAPEEVAKVSEAIFAAEQGALSPTVAISSSKNAWFDLKSVAPAKDQTLEEVRDRVLEAVTAEKVTAAKAAEAERIVAEVRAGGSLEDAAAALGQFPVQAPALSRQGDGTPVIDAGVAEAAFGGGPGHVGSARNGDGDYVIFRVVEVVPAEAENPQAASYIADAMRSSMFSDFVTGIRQNYGVYENAAVINQLLAPTPGQ